AGRGLAASPSGAGNIGCTAESPHPSPPHKGEGEERQRFRCRIDCFTGSKAGTHGEVRPDIESRWAPAFAGVTDVFDVGGSMNALIMRAPGTAARSAAPPPAAARHRSRR